MKLFLYTFVLAPVLIIFVCVVYIVFYYSLFKVGEDLGEKITVGCFVGLIACAYYLLIGLPMALWVKFFDKPQWFNLACSVVVAVLFIEFVTKGSVLSLESYEPQNIKTTIFGASIVLIQTGSPCLIAWWLLHRFGDD